MAAKRKNDLAWEQVEIVEKFPQGDPKVHCSYCDHEFRGGAARIALHRSQRASALATIVFVFSNLRILKKVSAIDYEEQFPMWPSSDDDE